MYFNIMLKRNFKKIVILKFSQVNNKIKTIQHLIFIYF